MLGATFSCNLGEICRPSNRRKGWYAGVGREGGTQIFIYFFFLTGMCLMRAWKLTHIYIFFSFFFSKSGIHLFRPLSQAKILGSELTHSVKLGYILGKSGYFW